MRVAAHFEDGSVAAYRLGRIEEGKHNLLIHTGETIPIDEFVGGLVRQAQDEYPDADIVVERLVQDPDNAEQGKWISAEEYDAENTPPIDAGQTQSGVVQASAPAGSEAEGEKDLRG